MRGSGLSGGLGGLLGARLGRRHCRHLGVFELDSGLALEDGAAVGERGRLVVLLGKLALGVGFGERTAVFDELEESAVLLGLDAGRPPAERAQVPGLTRLDGGAPRRSEAHPGEVCKINNTLRLDWELLLLQPALISYLHNAPPLPQW